MEYTIQDALKSLAETGNCPVPPPIMGKLIEVGYFEASINGMTSKEFYEKWLKENGAKQEDKMEKHMMATGDQSGIRQAVCPKCDTVMEWRDNYHMTFGRGEVEESGGEYLSCPECGFRVEE